MTAKFGTILLAAGVSTRMGPENKLLLPYRDVPMILHMVNTYRAATSNTVCVITGYEAAQIESVLEGTDAVTVFNAEYKSGQQSSVTLGLQSAKVDDALFIGLGDQPLITVADLQFLMSAHRESGGTKISVPMQGEAHGNPIIIPSNLRGKILKDSKGRGCKKFTRTHLEHVHHVPTMRPSFFTDVDTPQAYAMLGKTQKEFVS
jgi:molybdenum cofactor cytidylyltransferase